MQKNKTTLILQILCKSQFKWIKKHNVRLYYFCKTDKTLQDIAEHIFRKKKTPIAQEITSEMDKQDLVKLSFLTAEKGQSKEIVQRRGTRGH